MPLDIIGSMVWASLRFSFLLSDCIVFCPRWQSKAWIEHMHTLANVVLQQVAVTTSHCLLCCAQKHGDISVHQPQQALSHDSPSATSDTDEDVAVLHVRLNSLLQRASEEVFHSA